jgi:hypothetical protein
MTRIHPARPLSALCLGALLAATATPSLAAEGTLGVYECTRNGVTTFSDQPCGPAAKRIEVDYDKQNPAQAEAAAAAAGARARETQAGHAAEARLLDTEIINSKQRLSELPIRRAAEIALLRQEVRAGSESRDLAAWQAEMTAKVATVASRYQSLIDTEQARLDDLLAQRAALEAP